MMDGAPAKYKHVTQSYYRSSLEVYMYTWHGFFGRTLIRLLRMLSLLHRVVIELDLTLLVSRNTSRSVIGLTIGLRQIDESVLADNHFMDFMDGHMTE